MPSPITRRRIAASTTLALLVACSSDALAPDVLAPLIPLAVGTEWRYVVRDSVEIGESRPILADRFTVRVARDTTIGRERWVRVDQARLLFDDSHEGVLYLRNRSDGTYAWQPPPEDGFPVPVGFDISIRLFKYPARQGEASTLFPPSYVTATDTSITVPAGTFTTFRYDDAYGYSTSFVAPGIGVVKKVTGLSWETAPNGEVVGRWRIVYELEAMTP